MQLIQKGYFLHISLYVQKNVFRALVTNNHFEDPIQKLFLHTILSFKKFPCLLHTTYGYVLYKTLQVKVCSTLQFKNHYIFLKSWKFLGTNLYMSIIIKKNHSSIAQ